MPLPQLAPLNVPNYSAMTPTAQSAAQTSVAAAGTASGISDARGMAAMTNTEASNKFASQTLPQLQSSLAGAGQATGTAGDQALGNAAADAHAATGDVNSSMMAHINDLTRQQAYSSVGLML